MRLLRSRRYRARFAGRAVVVYTTPNCHLCVQACGVLDRLGIVYTVVDASDDPARFERTPVIEIDGSEVADATHQGERLIARLLQTP